MTWLALPFMAGAREHPRPPDHRLRPVGGLAAQPPPGVERGRTLPGRRAGRRRRARPASLPPLRARGGAAPARLPGLRLAGAWRRPQGAGAGGRAPRKRKGGLARRAAALARARWTLLPPGVRPGAHHRRRKLEALSRRLDRTAARERARPEAAKPAWAKTGGIAGAAALLLWKLKWLVVLVAHQRQAAAARAHQVEHPLLDARLGRHLLDAVGLAIRLRPGDRHLRARDGPRLGAPEAGHPRQRADVRARPGRLRAAQAISRERPRGRPGRPRRTALGPRRRARLLRRLPRHRLGQPGRHRPLRRLDQPLQPARRSGSSTAAAASAPSAAPPAWRSPPRCSACGW